MSSDETFNLLGVTNDTFFFTKSKSVQTVYIIVIIVGSLFQMISAFIATRGQIRSR